jgi:hypothetical protein
VHRPERAAVADPGLRGRFWPIKRPLFQGARLPLELRR